MIEAVAGMASVWWQWMSAMSVQLVAVFAVTFLLDRLLRRWVWPELLTVIWLVAMLKLVVPPAVASPLSVANLVPANQTVSAIAQPSVSTAVVPILFAIWVLGFLCLSIWTFIRYQSMKRAWFDCPEMASPAWFNSMATNLKNRLGIRRRVRLSIREGVTGSAVVGFFRPTIVLPADFVAQRPRCEVEHVLMHELAHVKRFDPITSLLCLGLQLAYWFHPAVWIVRTRLATLREICCDRIVADALSNESCDYRDTLLELARPWVMKPRAGQLGMIHRHSQLLHRLEWLERSFSLSVIWRRMATLSLCLLLLVCCVPLATPMPQKFTIDFDPSILDGEQGCMRTRLAVMQAMAEYEKANAPVF